MRSTLISALAFTVRAHTVLLVVPHTLKNNLNYAVKMVKGPLVSVLCLASAATSANAYAFVPGRSTLPTQRTSSAVVVVERKSSSSSSLQMIDSNVAMGAGIAVAGLAAGIGMVAFAESMGERSMSRGGGLSEDMSTKLAGSLMEDVEVSSVSDLGSLTSQLEQALKESGGAADETFEMSEEEKKRIEEEADDGW